MAHTNTIETNMTKDRSEEVRNVEKREAQIRKNIQMVFKGRLDIDPRTIPSDTEYAWILDSEKVEYGNNELEEAASKGWVPVTAEDRPDLALFDDKNRDRKKTVIRVKELILHQRPKKFGEYEREVLRQYNDTVMNSLPGQADFMRDPTMPTTVLQNKTTRSVG